MSASLGESHGRLQDVNAPAGTSLTTPSRLVAEICHVYCTSGGPYHWSFILAPAHSAPFISYLTGWFACA